VCLKLEGGSEGVSLFGGGAAAQRFVVTASVDLKLLSKREKLMMCVYNPSMKRFLGDSMRVNY
jgi:hypothetical protein